MRDWFIGVAVALLVLGVLSYITVVDNQQRALDTDCRSISYDRGISAGGREYCVREIISPRDNREAR